MEDSSYHVSGKGHERLDGHWLPALSDCYYQMKVSGTRLSERNWAVEEEDGSGV